MNNAPQHMPPLAPIADLGASALAVLAEMGAVFLFMLDGIRHLATAPKQFRKIFRQVYIIGAQSMFLIALIGAFTGMVIGLQGYYTLIKFGSVGMLGSAVALSIIRELGPVLTAIMVTGRAGSAMAAEIGVMRISDQLDALEVMDINPMGYLVSPRIAAAVISFPLLTAFFDVVGILGGYLTGVVMLGINQGIFFYRMQHSIEWADVAGGFVKSLSFGLIMAVICCYQGYFTHMRQDGMGPQGVSNATTAAVVITCVVVLIADYVLTSFLL